MRHRSPKRAKQEREYLAMREQILPCPCEVCQTAAATQLHHMAGRRGRRLTERANLLPVCTGCHRFITENPAWAEAHGWSRTRIGIEEESP